ncbi:MAG: PIN domain-containing protein [Dehalococcoidia bacterium]
MRFWDASALVPLIVEEPSTSALQEAAAADPLMVVWWGSEVECASAVARLERDGALSHQAAGEAFDRLTRLAAGWHEIDPGDALRETAVRFLRVHPLRAADALQLAAAFAAAERRPSTLEVVTLDERLALAARREGFIIVAPGSA